jgi:peptide/nickel transport system substrate-binding protein/oligopeptide transport system substrate-binding protein
MSKKNIFIILILTLNLFCLPACKTKNKNIINSNDVILSIQSDITSYDPAFSVDVDSGRILSKLYSGLFKFDDSGNIIGDLAEKWTIKNKGKQYLITLKKGIRFSNGKNLTSKDVLYTFNRLSSPKTGSPRSWILKYVSGFEEFQKNKTSSLSGIRAIDDFTIEINLIKPFTPFISMLAMVGSYILPELSDEKNNSKTFFDINVCGCGTYLLKSTIRNNIIHLVPKNKSNLPLIFRIIPDPATQIAEFRANNLDMINIPFGELKYFKKNYDKSMIKSVEKLNVYYLGLNNNSGLFKNVKIRQALNYAVNTKSIVNDLLDGSAKASKGPVPSILLEDMNNYPFYFSPEKSKKLLNDAGIKIPVKIEIWQKNGNKQKDTLIAMAEDMKTCGFEPKINTMEWSALKEAINNGKAECFFLSWSADYPDAENFLYPLFHSSNWGSNGNRARFSDNKVDELLDNACTITNKIKQKEVYIKARDRIVELAPWVFLWHGIETFAFSKKIKPFIPNPIYNAENGTNFVLRNCDI